MRESEARAERKEDVGRGGVSSGAEKFPSSHSSRLLSCRSWSTSLPPLSHVVHAMSFSKFSLTFITPHGLLLTSVTGWG